MKIKLAFASFIFLLTSVQAQNTNKVAIRVGYNLYTIYGQNSDGNNFHHRFEDGWHLGMDFDISLGSDFSLMPGIVYSQKGANFSNYEYMDQSFKGDVKLAYVEIPVNLVFKPKAGRGNFLIGTGPYLAYGVGREAGVMQGTLDVKFKNNVTSADLNETPFYYKPLDAGINFLAGYRARRGFLFQFNGQLGLTKINPTVNGSDDGQTAHHLKGFGFSLGYWF